MAPHSTCSRPFACIALGVLLALSAPAFAKPGAASKPQSKPAQFPTLILQGLEDQALQVYLAGEQASIVEAPSSGSVLTDRTPAVYVPYPDFNGVDTFMLEEGGAMRPVEVKIYPVNDAPTFIAGPNRSHLAGVAGEIVAPGWATGIGAGTPIEGLSQRVWFEVEPLSPGNASVDAVKIDAAGNLRYVLTGLPGMSTYRVRAADNGGTANGGVDRSAWTVLQIGVDATADLGIRILPVVDNATPGFTSYQVVVANKGPFDALASRVTEILPPDAGTPTWRCAAFDGASCPKGVAGTGAIDLVVDLPVDSMLVFSVSGMQTKPGSGLHAAFVLPPQHVVDPDTSNNEDHD